MDNGPLHVLVGMAADPAAPPDVLFRLAALTNHPPRQHGRFHHEPAGVIARHAEPAILSFHRYPDVPMAAPAHAA